MKVIWTEKINNDREWKIITFNYHNKIFEIIIYRFGYRDFSFYYETGCDLNLIEKEEIEDYLIKESKEKWYEWW